MNESEHRFIGFDGTPLFYRRLEPPGIKKATVLIVHGFGEHSGRYLELARRLCQDGLRCFLPDLRGFGQSGGKRGCLRFFTDYYRDLEVVHRLARAEQPEMPFFLLGHSFGGLVAATWLSDASTVQCRGLILSSPNFGIAIRIPWWRHWLAIGLSYLMPDHTENNGVDDQTLTHDTSIMLRAQKDPWMHHRISVRLYRELTHQISRTREIASKIRCAALVLQAGDDRVVSRKRTSFFYENLNSQKKELEIYEGLYHEILNETQRPAIFTRIAGWISGQI